MKDFKFTEEERDEIETHVFEFAENRSINCVELIDRIESLIQSRADASAPTPSDQAFTDKVVFDLKICQSELADKDREINKLNDSMTVLIRRVAELEERLTVANVKISFWRDSWNKSDREHTLAINRILELEQTVSELEGNVSEDDGYVYCPNCGRVKLD